MTRAVLMVVAAGWVLGSQPVSAQDLSRYRDVVLGSSLERVVAASGATLSDARTLHERPAVVQLLRWRAPYVSAREPSADPVREIDFSFYNDALYQVVVNYDRQRTAGLTNGDVIESVSASYGTAVLASAGNRFDVPAEAFPGSVVVARWQNADVLVMLLRAEDSPEFQLILVSKTLAAKARRAIRDALNLDMADAPRRDLEQRRKVASDAAAAEAEARVTNKAGFRP